MKSLWLENKNLRWRDDLPKPTIEVGEALIKTSYAGICATDLEIVKGYYPFTGVPGHEFVGVVEAAPEREDLIGKRVVGNINIVCHECAACLAGRPSHCENRKTLGIWNYNGVFSEFFKLPVSNISLVPDTVSDKQAVFTELLAAAMQIPNQVPISPTDNIVIIGAGRLGLLIAQVLAQTGANLTVVIRRPEPAKMLEKWGIRWAYTEDLAKAKADIVVEVTGSSAGFALSQSLVRPAGKLVLKSTFSGDVQVNLSQLVVNEVEVIGSRCGPMDAALEMLAQGKVHTDEMITAVYPIDQGLAGFEAAAAPGALKVLLKFPS